MQAMLYIYISYKRRGQSKKGRLRGVAMKVRSTGGEWKSFQKVMDSSEKHGRNLDAVERCWKKVAGRR